MKSIEVHFGGTAPAAIEYLRQPSGMAEVWLYQNIRIEKDIDGNDDYVADGVNFQTALSKEEVEAQRDIYFEDDTVADPADVAEQAYILAEYNSVLLEMLMDI